MILAEPISVALRVGAAFDELGVVRQEMSRRQRVAVGEEQHLFLASPEDIILQKLDWYRKSDGSERQWRDVLGVLKIRWDELDQSYMKHLAENTRLKELLGKAISDAGVG